MFRTYHAIAPVCTTVPVWRLKLLDSLPRMYTTYILALHGEAKTSFWDRPCIDGALMLITSKGLKEVPLLCQMVICQFHMGW